MKNLKLIAFIIVLSCATGCAFFSRSPEGRIQSVMIAKNLYHADDTMPAITVNSTDSQATMTKDVINGFWDVLHALIDKVPTMTSTP